MKNQLALRSQTSNSERKKRVERVSGRWLKRKSRIMSQSANVFERVDSFAGNLSGAALLVLIKESCQKNGSPSHPALVSGGEGFDTLGGKIGVRGDEIKAESESSHCVGFAGESVGTSGVLRSFPVKMMIVLDLQLRSGRVHNEIHVSGETCAVNHRIVEEFYNEGSVVFDFDSGRSLFQKRVH